MRLTTVELRKIVDAIETHFVPDTEHGEILVSFDDDGIRIVNLDDTFPVVEIDDDENVIFK